MVKFGEWCGTLKYGQTPYDIACAVSEFKNQRDSIRELLK